MDKEQKKEEILGLDKTIVELLSIQQNLNKISEENVYLSRYFNNKSFAFSYEVIDNEINRLKEDIKSIEKELDEKEYTYLKQQIEDLQKKNKLLEKNKGE